MRVAATGATAFARMPCGSPSAAATIMSAKCAIFPTAYAASPGRVRSTSIARPEVVKTNRPYPWRFIAGNAALVRWNGASTLTLRRRSQPWWASAELLPLEQAGILDDCVEPAEALERELDRP